MWCCRSCCRAPLQDCIKRRGKAQRRLWTGSHIPAQPAGLALLHFVTIVSFSAVLTAESVTKRFASVVAVDRLSFEVRPGEIFALLGPNGAGKTTTVRMLAGITQPDTGQLSLRLAPGAPATGRADPQQLGYLPEERGLYGDQKLISTLEYLAALRGLDRSVSRQRALTWLERFELADRARDRVQTLSKGNQQKIQFVASILHEPSLAVLDEPFSGFDPVNQDLVLSMIRELRDRGMTIVLSAHHMDLVETLADYILLMHEGRGVLRGTMAEIRAGSGLGQRLNVTFGSVAELPELEQLPGVGQVLSQTSSSARLALEPEAQVGRVLHELTGRLDVTDVSTDTPTLREIYLKTVNGSYA